MAHDTTAMLAIAEGLVKSIQRGEVDAVSVITIKGKTSITEYNKNEDTYDTTLCDSLVIGSLDNLKNKISENSKTVYGLLGYVAVREN